MALRFSTGLRNALCGVSLVTNGKFTSATTSWTATDSSLTSVTGGQEGNCLNVMETGAGTYGYAYQSITVRNGMKYRIEYFFKNVDANHGHVKVGTSADNASYYDSGELTATSWTRYVAEFVATGTTAVITLGTQGWVASPSASPSLSPSESPSRSPSISPTPSTSMSPSLSPSASLSPSKSPSESPSTSPSPAGVSCKFDEVVLGPVSGLRNIFDGALIEIRSGTQPTEPDDTVGAGVLLATISNNSTGIGITWEAGASGAISKSTVETWSGTIVASGTAAWFRLKQAGDLGTDNIIDCRIDGSVATAGGQLTMTNTYLSVGNTETINTFTLTIPMTV